MNKFMALSLLPFLALCASEKYAVLLTGLPCSGKTTLAFELKRSYFPSSVILDGDEVRKTVNSDLGFSESDRKEHLRRIVEMGKVILQSVDHIFIPVVSPIREARDLARKAFEEAGYKFLEVFVNASLDTCIRRDVKGMYKKAIAKEIPVFTGISAPYDVPQNPDVICYTENETPSESAKKIAMKAGCEDETQPHALFIGRWSPFHKGHWAVMDAVKTKKPGQPLLIFVRNTADDAWPASVRKAMVENSLKEMGVAAKVMIIPNITSVNWGRDVGYETNMVDVDVAVQKISGTQIRRQLQKGDTQWKELVCPGVSEVIDAYEKEQVLNRVF
jgi:adenylylsulfate kinase